MITGKAGSTTEESPCSQSDEESRPIRAGVVEKAQIELSTVDVVCAVVRSGGRNVHQ